MTIKSQLEKLAMIPRVTSWVDPPNKMNTALSLDTAMIQ